MQNRAKIDEIDAKILKVLLEESRTSFTSLSKICGVSTGAVRVRYKNLWKKGIINGEIMLVNPYSLTYNHTAIIGIISNIESEEKVIEFLKKLPFVGLVFPNFGKYNLAVQVALPSIEELSETQRLFETHKLIEHADALIFADEIVVEHPENLIIKPFNGEIEHKTIVPKKKSETIDEIDRKIVRILSYRSRTPFRKIAIDLGISTKNVIERYKKLRGKVLTLSTITIDLSKLGYAAGAFLFIKLESKSKIVEARNQLLMIPNLLTLVKYIGNHDLFAYVVLEDFNQYFKLQMSLRKINSIAFFDAYIAPTPPAWPPNLYASLF